jgi:hypothetical protein
MFGTTFLLSILLIILALLLLYFKFNKKPASINSNQTSSFLSHQELYDAKRKNERTLSDDEKIELSWQFLYDITDYVLKKFSKEDLNLVHKIGGNLIKFGMSYQHVVEYGIFSYKKNQVKTITEDKEIKEKRQTSL